MKKYSLLASVMLIFSFIPMWNMAQPFQHSRGNLYSLYPQNGSKFVSRKAGLIIKSEKKENSSFLSHLTMDVNGSKSGSIKGTLSLTQNGTTILFKPVHPFLPGEEVRVTVSTVHKNRLIPALHYHFSITPLAEPLQVPNTILSEEDNSVHYTPHHTLYNKENRSGENLPEDFPYFNVTVNDHPGRGEYFVNALARDSNKAEYNLIIDTTGFPLCYQRFPWQHRENFFTFHPQTGTLTYFDEVQYRFLELDNAFQIIGGYAAQNGYSTDVHELLVQSDGSYWVLSYDPQPMDMSQIVPGGCTSAIVIGLIIQEVDADTNVIFQWSSWDHFNITDADTNMVDLTACLVDYVHGNGLALDSTGNVLLSSRHLSEITKIDKQTGNIIWRFGGNNNQFTFINDTIPFRAQHNITYDGNHTYSIFDNGNKQFPLHSQALTFYLDETNKTATLLKNLQKTNPPDFTPFMGSNQKLDKGSRLVGWAANYEKNVLTQYDSSGAVIFNIQSVDTFGIVSYRAAKFPWETSLFSFDRDTLNFGSHISTGDSAFASVCLYNHSDTPLEINGYNSTDSAVTLKSNLPFIVAPNGCDTLFIRFIPKSETPVSAAVSFYYQTDSSRIANQFRVIGGGNVDKVTPLHTLDSKLLVAPNPMHLQCTVQFADNTPIASVKVYNLSGQQVFYKTYHAARIVILNRIEKGVYLLQANSKKGRAFSKLIVQ